MMNPVLGYTGLKQAQPMDRVDPIAAIYDAAIDPGAWARLPEIVATAVDGGSASLFIFDSKTGSETISHGLANETLRLYDAHFHSLDPWYLATRERGLVFHASLGTDLVPELRFRQTEFSDFARSVGIVDIVGGQIPIGAGRVAGIGVHRPQQSRRFGARHAARLQALFPHLQRVFQLRDRLGAFDPRDRGFAALDAIAVGAIVCDRHRRIQFANRAAEALTAGSIGLRLGDARDGIVAAPGRCGKRLAALIADAANGGAGGGMVIDIENAARIFALVVPLPSRLSGQPGLVLVTIRSAEEAPTFGADIAASLFNLTPAEAALALALFAGRSLGEYCAARTVSENTLRSQLASIFRKTETQNQRELIRLFGLIPALHYNGGRQAPPTTTANSPDRDKA